MKSRLRVLVMAAAVVSAVLLATFVGYRVGQGQRLAGDAIETMCFAAYADLQLQEGTDSVREQATRDFLARLERRKVEKPAWFIPQAHALDVALTNARLHLFALKRGASDEARQYLERATAMCPELGWQECSGDKILSAVRELDNRGLFSKRP